MMMRYAKTVAVLVMLMPGGLAWPADFRPASKLVEHGRYVTKIAGCNDCHTPGYADAAGKVAEKDWLVGDRLGWRGPWGTTYPSNLRTLINGMSEAQWLNYARTLKSRPPMPSFTLNEMRKADLRAIYHFIRSLGPAGVPTPAYVPPEQQPTPPFVQYPAPPK